MRKTTVLLTCGVLALGAGACEKAQGEQKPTRDTKTPSSLEADNTGRNVRERDATELTPKDQGNGAVDLQITKDVRQKLMADDRLSTDAKNVKVITTGGVVTLKGTVKDEAERRAVVAAARSVATTQRVDDQLDVKNEK
ncbi:MAG TPA: BON domain-containing protein [Minicystis sp.]|nr:BON domain-containing protein [Minicystis sp.]